MCVCLKLCFISSLAFFDCKEDGIFPKPPSYNVATTLPSYDEAERTKAETNVPLVPGRVSVSLFFFFCLRSHSVHTLSHTHTLVHWCLCLNTSCVVCKARSLIAQLWNFFFSLLHVCDCIFSARLCYRIEQMQIQKWRKTFLLVHIKGHLLISLHSVPTASRSVVLRPFLISSLCTWLFVLFTQNQSKYRCSLSTVWQA